MAKKYTLPKNIYKKVYWVARDYWSNKLRYEACISRSVDMDGHPHGSGVGDPTARDAALRVRFAAEIEPVEKALKSIPEEYRKGIFANVTRCAPFPDYAALNTWKRWKRKYMYYLAIYYYGGEIWREE